ncbi:hypothetical protein GVN21_15260 [Caulobacter sp. SLTY]|uniref:hypothetical protein n=1 Tax=Caulobacter sp. SLTY TaxID=2683262 RepID=UPI001411C183|nr:hypothetical protein [Caulobacter sp. SLTY]NBB16721.1 hypothetical protein [Caulobacter sp. SLTY]
MVVELHHGDQPIALDDLADSFSALSSLYQRHYSNSEDAISKLYVTRVSSGSIIAELAPYAPFFGQAMTAIGHSVTVADFTKRLGSGLKSFISPDQSQSRAKPSADSEYSPDQKDAQQLREFIKPLVGKSGASLKIQRARFEKIEGNRATYIEYEFSESELNRASINMDRALSIESDTIRGHYTRPHFEVMLFFDSASRGPGKERGRTRDYAVVPEISPRALPVYFRTGVEGNTKEAMVRGETNPLTDVAYIVDLHAQMIDDEPKGYIVTNVHNSLPLAQDGA